MPESQVKTARRVLVAALKSVARAYGVRVDVTNTAPDAAVRFRDALPNGTLVTVAKCGHNVHSQNTLGFIDALDPFLAGLD